MSLSIPSFDIKDKLAIGECLLRSEECYCINDDGFFDFPIAAGTLLEFDCCSIIKNDFGISNSTVQGTLRTGGCGTGDIVRKITMDTPFKLWLEEDNSWGVRAVFKSTQQDDDEGVHVLEFPGGFPSILTGLMTKRITCEKMPSVFKVIGEMIPYEHKQKLFDNGRHFAMKDSNGNFLICSNGCARGLHKSVPFEHIENIIGFDPKVLDRMRNSGKFNMRSLKDWDVEHRPGASPIWTKKEQKISRDKESKGR